MKKQILNLGLSLTRAEQKMVYGGNPINQDGNGGDEQGSGGSGGPGSGGGGSQNCGNYATCTHDGDCYNVINNAPSSCMNGCCITPF
jgi:hypothetical protein